jgi:hypothetical protein
MILFGTEGQVWKGTKLVSDRAKNLGPGHPDRMGQFEIYAFDTRQLELSPVHVALDTPSSSAE